MGAVVSEPKVYAPAHVERHEPGPCDYFVKMGPPACFVACRWCGIRPLRGLKSTAPLPHAAAMREVARLRAAVEADPAAHLCSKSPTVTLTGYNWEAVWTGEERWWPSEEERTYRAFIWRVRVWSGDVELLYSPTVGVARLGASFDSKAELITFCRGAALTLRALHPDHEPAPEPDNVIPMRRKP